MFRFGLAFSGLGLVALGIMAQDTPPTSAQEGPKAIRVQKREIRKGEGKLESVPKPVELKIEIQKKAEGTGEKRTIVIAHPKEGAKVEAKAFAFTLPEGQAHSKVITIVVGEDGKVIRTETNETKGKAIEIEIPGGAKLLDQIQKDLLKQQGKNIEIIKEGKKIQLGSGGNAITGLNGSIILSSTTETKNLEAILKRLEKIEKTLEEIKAKGK